VKLYLRGHDNKYAVEQMLLTLYPSERPEYPAGKPEGDRAEISRSRGGKYTTVSCRLYQGGSVYPGRAAMRNELMAGAVMEDRCTQRMIKTAFYRAAMRAGHEKPVWGALTGVRPCKLMTALLDEGLDDGEALRRFIADYDVSPGRAALCLDAARASREAEKSLGARDVCLYVGIPFCPTRCAYCSFVSQSVEKSMKLIPPFLEALEAEIAAVADAVRELGLRVVSIYMGGGTPTTLSAEQLSRLCGILGARFDLSALREYTVEAGRPDTITAEKLLALRANGVGRVSVNPQTMSDDVLRAIGRRHTAGDVLEALDKVRSSGGFEVNMDLIAGLETDTVESFRRTVDIVAGLAPENVTVHTLSLKRGSRLTLEGGELPSAPEVGAMLDYAGGVLRSGGYSPYYLYRQKFMSGGFENVGWTQPGHENLYNICIMEELCSILAMGGGGSTKLTAPGNGRNIRLMAPKYPAEYIAGIGKLCTDKKRIKEFYNGISTF
jgi:oxygen-independent coproporphyrinogen-3 oxidase